MNKQTSENEVIELVELEISIDETSLPITTNITASSSRGIRTLNAASPSREVDELVLADVITNYIQYYASGDSHTARAKRYDLHYLMDFIVETCGRSRNEVLMRDWTLQVTKDFIAHRLNMGEAPATVSRRLATIKHMGRSLAERVPGYVNPAREARGPVVQNTRPQSLNETELELLAQAANTLIEQEPESFVAWRNYLLLRILLATGLRADEVRLLRLGQLTSDLSWLKNVRTKGRKFRNVYLEESIRSPLTQYLQRRDRELLQKSEGVKLLSPEDRDLIPLFISCKGASPVNPKSFALAPKTLWRIIAEWGTKAQALSLTPLANLHPHLLRHTFALGLLDSSKDVRLVAQALGHSDVRTTMRYTERIEEEIAQAIEQKSDIKRQSGKIFQD